MRKILAILIGFLMMTAAVGGLGSSSLQKSLTGASVDGQIIVNESGIPTGDTGLTFNATTNVLTATGGFVGKNVPGENAQVLFANDSTAYDCDDEGQVFNNDVGLFVENKDTGRLWTCDTATNQIQVGRHLLDSKIITVAQSTVELNSVGWGNLYDSVEIEIMDARATVNGRLRIKLLTGNPGNTTLVTSGLTHVSQTWEAANSVLRESSTTWATNSTANQHIDASTAFACKFTFFKGIPGPQGFGKCTYTTATAESLTGVFLYLEMSSTYTLYDGFSIDITGGTTIKGTFKLWGISSN